MALIITWIIITTLILNFLLLITMIFIERKKPQAIMSWLFILTIFPIIGFLFYVIFGSGLSIRTRRMLKRRKFYANDYYAYIEDAISLYSEELKRQLETDGNLIQFNINNGNMICPGNDVKVYLNGKEKMQQLLKDINSAKHSINIEYYIFADDETGKKVMNALIKKAQSGVRVKLIYDSVGSLKTPRRFFNKLKKAGGEVAEFFPPFMYIRLINFKMNYRNHRKIIVIDGKIGYTGGINIRDDHMGKNKKLTPWRDTHIKILGSGVYALQNAFFNDWRYCKRDIKDPKYYFEQGYFPKAEICGDIALQIVTSGPDLVFQNIKETYVKLLTNAKKRVFIQSPYFIPDEVFMSSIIMAKKSGVDVKVMLPLKPDKKFVYLVTLSFAKELVDAGIEVYLYDGFLHSKVVLVDDNKLSIGTCNTDNRSFALNFEVNAIMFSESLNTNYAEDFMNDISKCIKIDKDYFKEKFFYNKMGQAIFRLLSPLL